MAAPRNDASSRARQAERIRAFLREVDDHHDELIAFDRICHVDVGWRRRAGRRTCSLAIRLFIDGPKRCPGPSMDRLLAPSRFHEVPVDVIPLIRPVGGVIVPGDPKRVVRADPLVGGMSVGGDSGEGPGTLGVILRTSSGRFAAITAQHVVNAGRDHVVLQPATEDSTGQSRPIAHQVESWDPWDVSVLWLDTEVAPRVGAIMDLPQITGVATRDELHTLVQDKAKVVLSGRSTPRALGIVEGIEEKMSENKVRASIVTIARATSAKILTRKGDSGSTWVTKDGRLVAIHTDGGLDPTSPHAFGTAAWLVAEKWGLRV